jgi:hypothetical protein
MEHGKAAIKSNAISAGAVVLASAIVNIVFSALSTAPAAG